MFFLVFPIICYGKFGVFIFQKWLINDPDRSQYFLEDFWNFGNFTKSRPSDPVLLMDYLAYLWFLYGLLMACLWFIYGFNMLNYLMEFLLILFSASSWPYRFILGILFGSRLMAHGLAPIFLLAMSHEP